MQDLVIETEGTAERRGPQSVHRVLALLLSLGSTGPSASLSELAEQVDLPASTTFRLLNALVDTGFATQDATTKRYSLGPSVSALASHAGNPHSLRMIARPRLEALRAKLKETVFVSILADHEIEYLDVLVSEQSVRMVGHPGELGPLYASSQGKAILANLEADRRDQLLDRLELRPYTRYTITDKRKLRDQLNEIRVRGYALGNMEHEDGIRAVAAPIFDRSGHVIAAVCAAAPAFRASLTHVRRVFAPEVIAAAQDITRRVQTAGAFTLR